MLTRSIIILVCLLFAGCATSPAVPEINNETYNEASKTLYIKMPWALPVKFSGELDLGNIDSVGGNGGYVSDYGLGGAVVAAQLIGQAIGTNSAKNKRYEAAKNEADKILEPYSEQLLKFDHGELWHGLDKSAFTSPVHAFSDNQDRINATIIEIKPEFILTQNQKALILENNVSVYNESTPDLILYQNRYIIVSDSVDNEVIGNYWSDEEYQPFKSVGLELFNASIQLVNKTINQSISAKEAQRTHRYLLGEQKQFERGSLVRESCDRLTIKNLHGHIVNAPKLSEDILDSCS